MKRFQTFDRVITRYDNRLAGFLHDRRGTVVEEKQEYNGEWYYFIEFDDGLGWWVPDGCLTY